MPKKTPRDERKAAPSPLKHSPFAGLRTVTPEGGPELAAPAPVASEAPPPPPPDKPRPRRVVLRRETKRRGGKAVVIVGGLAASPGYDDAAIEALAQQLKKQLGCGGTVEAGEIVLQGDRPAAVAGLLRGLGFRVDGVTS